MKHELFVEQPSTDLKAGIVVKKETELHFKNERVEQVLKDLILETITNNEGTHNGINAFKTKSYIHLGLNEGDILYQLDSKNAEKNIRSAELSLQRTENSYNDT